MYRAYLFGLDFTRLLKKKPDVEVEHKKLIANPIVWTTHTMIMKLPLDWVRGLTVGKWASLPNSFKNMLKKAIDDTNSHRVLNCSLYSLDGVNSPSWKMLIRDTTQSKMRYYYQFTQDDCLKFDLSHEPWILARLMQLHNVCSGRCITFGTGARTRSNVENETNPSQIQIDSWKNFWFDIVNREKLCVDGAFGNILHHMQDHNTAMLLKRISSMTNPIEIAAAVGVSQCPKYISDRNINDFKKCIWILRQNGNYVARKVKKGHLRCSANEWVRILDGFNLPVIATLNGLDMTREHVIAIWQNQIVDYESKYTYPLTVDNLHYSCGVGCQFDGFVGVTVLFPPRSIQMRYTCKDGTLYKWGGMNDPGIKSMLL